MARIRSGERVRAIGNTANTEGFTMLDKTDIRAIRNADALCFDHLPDGTGRIRAILRAESSSTGFEQTHTVEVASTVRNLGSNQPAAWSGYEHVGSPKYNDVIRTIVRRLRVGDEVALRWTRDNASPVLVDAGLVRDELAIAIGKPGTPADSYLVRTFVGLDNTARMIRCA